MPRFRAVSSTTTAMDNTTQDGSPPASFAAPYLRNASSITSPVAGHTFVHSHDYTACCFGRCCTHVRRHMPVALLHGSCSPLVVLASCDWVRWLCLVSMYVWAGLWQ